MRDRAEIEADLAVALEPGQDDDAAYMIWHDAVLELLDDVPELLDAGDRHARLVTAVSDLAEDFAERGAVEHDEHGIGEGYAECPKCVSLDLLAAIAAALEKP